MAKNSLINGSIWEQYSQKVQDRMNNPRYMGEITEEEAKARGGKLVVADFGAESCGDAVRLYWLIDPKTDRILDAKFKRQNHKRGRFNDRYGRHLCAVFILRR